MGSILPLEVVLNTQKTVVSITYDSGEKFEYDAEFLRVYSPSAEIKGHGQEPRKVPGGKKNVKIAAIEQVGNYALKFIFSDGHDTGIYSWSYLHEIGQNREELWKDYLNELSGKGLYREN